jgi:hypothetical protein
MNIRDINGADGADIDSLLQVRCSGEKDGCTRCRRNGLYCEYRVSMVGRAPKKRRTRDGNQDSHPRASRDSQDAPSPFSVPTPGDLAPTVNTSDEAVFAIGNFPSVSAAMEMDGRLLETPFGNYPGLPLVSPGAADPFWLATADMLLGPHPEGHGVSSLESADTSSDSQQAPWARSRTSEISDEDRPLSLSQDASASSVRSRLFEQTAARVPKTYRDKSVVSHYPHVASLMSIIEYLECQLQISQVAVDQAMRLNRQAMAHVRVITNTDGFRRCQSCPPLVATIMDLAVGLYELVILSIQQPTDEDDAIVLPDRSRPPSRQSSIQPPAGTGDMPSGSTPRSSASASGGKEAPLFQFGCLEFDPDEQEMFRNAMVRRDLQRCIETIQFCSREMQRRQQQAASLHEGGRSRGGLRLTRSYNDRVQRQWYEEMERRATQLLASLPAKCGHGERRT